MTICVNEDSQISSAKLPTALVQTPCLYRAGQTSEDHHSLNENSSRAYSRCVSPLPHKYFLHHAFSLHVCVLCDKNIHLLLKEEIHYKSRDISTNI